MNEKRAADSGSIPVVLVPGWLDNANKMGSLATFLRKEGFATLILSPQPSDGSVPVETLAGQLAEEIERRFAPGQMIDFVGFSMGGLIGRAYLHWMGGSERMLKRLDLSEAQRDQVFELRHAQAPQMRAKWKEARNAREALRELSWSGDYDAGKAAEFARQGADAMAEIAGMRAKLQADIYQLLSPEQRTRLAEMRATQGRDEDGPMRRHHDQRHG